MLKVPLDLQEGLVPLSCSSVQMLRSSLNQVHHSGSLLNLGLVGTHMQHVYDFYKPDLTSKYPIVDGHFSIRCYIRALDSCYRHYNAKYDKCTKATNGTVNGTPKDEPTGIDRFGYIAFHTPTCKVVQK